jgi:hypothetical protein
MDIHSLFLSKICLLGSCEVFVVARSLTMSLAFSRNYWPGYRQQTRLKRIDGNGDGADWPKRPSFIFRSVNQAWRPH